ncbi:glycosyltransferase family 2 protein [Desemzia sp. C1]|uniref:glycosyltransferase family 2 protein n=1 Tax=Desemzia sp. C1 TaxID=2892016 RepID=UPI001E3DC9A8|nr:glycosyltransferase family 2 protein [Desemzia sp. C1]MCI3028747.1 glycosyltransferase family 2 protein [Desemzia sp. C1]
MSNVSAVIVLFNPNIVRLKENINSIINQVKEIVLVDNGSKNIELVKKEYENNERIFFINNKENLGVAAALNQGMDFFKKKNYSWVLTLDQDSVSPSNLISELGKYTEILDVGIICPNIIDRNNIRNQEKTNGIEYTNQCITSGSLTNTHIWESVDKFDEKLFIDLVDFEYCNRLGKNAFKIIKVYNVDLLHEIGNITQHKFLFWEVNVMNHSAFRKFYMSRNLLYCARKSRNISYLFTAYIRIAKILLSVLLYESNKLDKIKEIFHGLYKGMIMSL